MRHDAQFNLRIVRGHNAVAVTGNKCLTDTAAFIGSDRNILQVRVTGRKTAGRGHCLVIRGMHTAGFRIHHQRQFIGIGGFQFGQAAVFEDHSRQFMVIRQLFQHFLIG